MKPRDYWKERGWQWRPNPERGESYILEVWITRALTKADGTLYKYYEGWGRRATVFKVHRGDRWVYQNGRTGKTQGFTDIRTAMRMAVFLTLLEKRQ